MRILILGGSKFLGPHLIDAALARSHRVTVFNRGRAPWTAPYGVEVVHGDRDGELSKLSYGRWDAVIDTSGYLPRVVRLSVEALRGVVDHYAFVSSISAYADPMGGAFDEAEPLAVLADPAVEAVTPEVYGGLKALCESEVTRGFADRALIVRPGLIVGPLDPTDRFTYWVNRFALGGDVLAPGKAGAFVSFIDVRDLARWIVVAVEARRSGAFNASGTYGVTTMGDVMDACMRASGSGTAVWVSEAFLLANGVVPWSEMPLWIPEGEDTVVRASSAKAVAAGLTYRPLDETVQATLEWTKRCGLERELRAGISRARESELLALARVHEET